MLPTHIIGLIIGVTILMACTTAFWAWGQWMAHSVRKGPHIVHLRTPEDLTGGHIPLQPVPSGTVSPHTTHDLTVIDS